MAEQNQITRALLANPNRKPGKPNWEVGPGGFASQEEIEAMTMAREKTPQTRQELAFKHYQYWAPFNYPNVRVEIGPGGEFNMDGVELDVPPLGAITIVEDEPIVGVTVIGSACAPPGHVMVHGEPLVWKYPRSGVKMMVDGLWGEHLNAPLWAAGIKEGPEQRARTKVSGTFCAAI